MNDIFIYIKGVTGESTDSAHQGWTEVDAYSWGTERKGEGTGVGKVNYLNLSVHCQVNKGTAAVLLFSSNGNRIGKVELSACKAGDGQMEYYRVTLEHVIVVEVRFRDHGRVTEVEYVFQADRVKFQYWEQSALGGRNAETRMGWDIKNAMSDF